MNAFNLIRLDLPICDVDATFGYRRPAVAGPISTRHLIGNCGEENFSTIPVSRHTPSRSDRAIAANRRPAIVSHRDSARTTKSETARAHWQRQAIQNQHRLLMV